jgi:putative restriction endonuclease
MVDKSNNWSREQLLVAFNLYCQLPFGKLHAKNPTIVRFANAIGRTPSALAMKLTNIASLDPAITSTGRTGLAGASKADKAMWLEMERDWEHFALESQAALDRALTAAGCVQEVDAEGFTETVSEVSESPNYTAENRLSTTQIRIGQHFFRRAVLSAYQGRCCITGVSDTRLLVASHIVPWRSDKQNRLNPRNGLCLSALHDRAFDQGLFTFVEGFKIKLAREVKTMPVNRFVTDWLLGLENKSIELPEKFQPLEEFIDWHRRHIFLDR